MAKKELSFYDVKKKKKFKSNKYRIEVRGKRRFAVAKTSHGTEAWRVLGMA